MSIRKVGVVGVLVRNDRLLVIQRSRHVKAALKYCFPGGGMETGEAEEEAVVRELREEMGVDVEPVRFLHRSITPWQVDLRWWQISTSETAVFQLNPLEVAQYLWLSYSEMLALPDLLESNRIFLAAWINREFEIHGLSRP